MSAAVHRIAAPSTAGAFARHQLREAFPVLPRPVLADCLLRVETAVRLLRDVQDEVGEHVALSARTRTAREDALQLQQLLARMVQGRDH